MVHLKLLGQPTAAYENVKRLIVERAAQESIDIEIEEIQAWEQIIEEDVPAIPTVRINQHRSYTLEQNADVVEFVNRVCDGLIVEDDQLKIRRILVATDFSKASESAMTFALELAACMEGNITAVHAIEVVSMNDDGTLYLNPRVEESKKKTLYSFVEKAKNLTTDKVEDPKIDQRIILGNVVDSIVDATSLEFASLLIMGSSAKGKRLKKWFGSATTELADKSPIPLLIIPSEVGFVTPNRIAYAYDQLEIDRSSIDFLARFARFFDAHIHLVHISPDKPSVDSYELLQMWKRNYPKSKIFLHEVRDQDVDTGLIKFIENEEIDLLAMTPTKHGCFHRIFHTPLTKEMSIHCPIPLLVLH